MVKFVELYNNVNVPNIAFGTGRMNSDSSAHEAILKAIEVGFTHFDCSTGYDNFDGVNKAFSDVLKSGVARETLFVTQKIDPRYMGFDKTTKIIEKTLADSNLQYLDMVLIHCPYDWNVEWKRYIVDTWRAMEKMYQDGKIRAIGVSNFNFEHLALFLNYARIMPMINQIELHPCYQQKRLVQFCLSQNIKLEAWSPLMYVVNNDLLKQIAQKYNKNSAQVALRWSIQKGYIPICSTKIESEMKSDLEIYDFELSKEDMEYIDSLDGGMYSTDNQKRIIDIDHRSLLDGIENQRFYKQTPYKKYVKLFGFIPLMKIVKKRWNIEKWYLFGLIPILKIQKRELN